MNFFRRSLRFLLVFGAGLAFLGLVATGVLYAIIAPSLPSVEVLEDVRLQVPLRVYTRGGRLTAVFGEQRRIPVALNEVPEQLRQAFLAAEDDRFYEHPGVDWQGILRAAWFLVLTGEKGQGGSTITMQLARNFFLEHERTYIYKLKQIFLALKIEREFPKERIFELYLNKIYLGHRAYGVAAAAQVYYGKPLYELTLAETAMIASLPKAPSVINPITSPERAVERRNYVLNRMHSLGHINEQAYQEAINTPSHAKLHGAITQVTAPWAAEMVRKAALERFGPSAYTDGYEIYTTIDGKLQSAANVALQDALESYDRRHGYRGPEARVPLGEPSDSTEASQMTHADDSRLIADTLDGYQIVAGLVPALVTEVSDTRAEVALADGRRVTLEMDGVSWARPYLNVDAVGPAPETMNDVVARGDVIRVEKTDTGWRLAQIPEVQGALIALDPFDGSVRALSGGYDYAQSKYNRVVQARRQPGSSFKPFIYSAALEHGFTAATLVNDAPVVFDDPSLERTWRPENFSQRFYGPTRLREALVNSRNLVSIRVLNAIGIDAAVEYLPRFGFEPERLPRGLSLALGTAVESPLEMARGYAVFANGGFRIDPYFVERIVSPSDNIGFDAAPAIACLSCDLPVTPQARVARSGTTSPVSGTNGQESTNPLVAEVTENEPAEKGASPDKPDGPMLSLAPRVIDATNAYIMDTLMEDVIRRGTGRRAMELGRNDLSGKTGTTNDQVDAWFSGYHHSLVATAWVGFDQPQPLGKAEVGGRAALPMWIDFMKVALEGLPPRDLPMPPGVVTVRIDPETGKRARAGNPEAILELFRADQIPPLLQQEDNEPDDDDQDNPYEVY